MTPIALIDYRAGNLTSVKKALAAVGADVFVPETPAAIARAHGIVVPGVGHFGATRRLDGEWTEAILALVADGTAAARHLPRHAVAVRRQRRGARLRRARRAQRPVFPAARLHFDQRRTVEGAARRLERARSAPRRRDCRRACPTRRRSTSRTAIVAPVTADTVAETSTARCSRRSSSAARLPACSSTPRNRATSASRFCETSCDRPRRLVSFLS